MESDNNNVFIHENAIVETDNIGKGTRVWAFAHILKDATVGENCNICDHTFIEGNVVIGDNVTIKCGVYLWSGLTIEDNVFIGPNATFTNDIKPRSKVYPADFIKTNIFCGASIGANATIICGNMIGKWAMVGAGSVVTNNVPDYAIVYGNPAILHGYVCECTKMLEFTDTQAKCSCGKNYRLESDIVTRI